MYYFGYLICFSFVSVQCFENKQLYFAKRLNEAMKVVIVKLPFFMLKCGGETDVRNISACRSGILLEEYKVAKFSFNSVTSAAVVKLRACKI